MSYSAVYKSAIHKVTEAVKDVRGCLPPESDSLGAFVSGIVEALSDALSPAELELLRYAIQPADVPPDPFEAFAHELKAAELYDPRFDRMRAAELYDRGLNRKG